MAISDSLTRYIGPLPAWGWGAVGIGGLFLYKKFKSGSSSSLTSALSGSGTGQNTADAQTASGTEAASTDSSAGTNASWATSAIQYLESEGYTSSQAQSAIGTYTAGGTIDPSMATLVDNAVQAIGQPPQLVFPTSASATLSSTTTASQTTSSGAGNPVGTTTATGGTGTSSLPSYVVQHQAAYSANGATYAANGPKDSSGHQAYFKYTVKKGDTQAKLASMFGSSASQIEAWNNLKNGASIKAGQSIWV